MCSDEEIEKGGTYQHHKGKYYRIVGIANTANINPKYPPVVVFKSLVNGNLWTKPIDDFKAKMTKVRGDRNDPQPPSRTPSPKG